MLGLGSGFPSSSLCGGCGSVVVVYRSYDSGLVLLDVLLSRSGSSVSFL